MSDVARVELAPGYTIAEIINGCWQLSPGHGGGIDSKKATLRRFAELVDHGFTSFDCADIYTGTEQLLGEFRRSLNDPDSIQVHTKYVPDKNTLGELNNTKIDAAIDRSLSNLGVDRLDLVQFHWWDYDVDGVERTYERLLHLQNEGKIRLIGTTNFNTEQLRKLLAVDPSIISMQAQFSLLDRRPERSMQQCCLDQEVSLLAYGVLAGGFLTGRYLGEPPPANMNRSLQKYRLIIDEAGGWPALQTLLDGLSAIAGKHRCGIDAIAARWVLDQPSVDAIILGTGTRSRASENLAISVLRLDGNDRQHISELLEALTPPPGEPYDIERDPDSVHSSILRTNLQDKSASQ